MHKFMDWSNPFDYHYERGLYYHEVATNLLCGTQLRNPQEVQQLHREEKITTVLNLQQDKDIEYWGIDFDAVRRQSEQLQVKHIRRPARDFDPDSLRRMLPAAVRVVAEELSADKRVYVHCTAGLGRAPAVCIAYLYWFRGMQLDEAYQHVTAIRPCGPKRDAVRAATYDLLSGRPYHGFAHEPPHGFAFLNDHDRSRIQRKVLNS